MKQLLRRLLWPSDRWRRIRNLAGLVFLLLAIVIRFELPDVLQRSVASLGLNAFLVFGIYAYEAWRRDRPHTDTYAEPDHLLQHCSDPEWHDAATNWETEFNGGQ